MNKEIENDLNVFEEKLLRLLSAQRSYINALVHDETTVHGKHFGNCVAEILDCNRLIADTLLIKVPSADELRAEAMKAVAESEMLERMYDLDPDKV